MSGRGSSRESRREQSARWCCLSTGRPVEGGGGGSTCLGSSDTASLNWCFENRNVSSFGTCFVCLCFQRTSQLSSRSSPCNSLENAKTCTRTHRYAGDWNHSGSMLHCVAECGVSVYIVKLSVMERVHIFISFTLPPRPPSSSGYGLSQSSRRADLLADGVDCILLPVKTRGTISALYTITQQPCFYLQIGARPSITFCLCLRHQLKTL